MTPAHHPYLPSSSKNSMWQPYHLWSDKSLTFQIMQQLGTIEILVLNTYYVTQHQLCFTDALHLLWIHLASITFYWCLAPKQFFSASTTFLWCSTLEDIFTQHLKTFAQHPKVTWHRLNSKLARLQLRIFLAWTSLFGTHWWT